MSYFSVDYFTLFGLEVRYDHCAETIKEKYITLQQQLHPDRFVGAAPQTKQLSVHYAAEINQAYRILSDPLQRAIYLLKLHGIEHLSEHPVMLSEDFLTEQITLREKIVSGENVSAVIEHKIMHQIACITQAFREDLQTVSSIVYQMQFYMKIKQELESHECWH